MSYATYLEKQLDYELMKEREGHIQIIIIKTGLTKKQDVGGCLEITKGMRECAPYELLVKQIDKLFREVCSFPNSADS